METPQNPKYDPLYQRGAQTVYAAMREASVEAGKVGAGYGKWLISTILLLNAGAIAGLFTFIGAMAAHQPVDTAAYAEPIAWFAAAILAILSCGFMTWLNWSNVSLSYNRYAQPWMVADPAEWPKDEGSEGWTISVSYWGAVASGLISVGLMTRGAHLVLQALGL